MSNQLEHETSQTSSIGAVWPPEAAPFDRLRGFYTDGIVESGADARNMGRLVHHYEDELTHDPNLTRLSIRFVAQSRQLRVIEAMGVSIEAAIPLATDSDELVLAYAGHNTGRRNIDPASLHRHKKLLRTIRNNWSVDQTDRAEQIRSKGYGFNILDKYASEEERRSKLTQFHELYDIFGYSEADTKELLENPSNTIVSIEEGDKIVSTAMAERASIAIRGFGNLELKEITEASTRPDYRKQGLYKDASGILLRYLHLSLNEDPAHAIYGESNLAMQGVLIAGHENNRHFSHFDQARYNLRNPAFGFLIQNFRIEDGQERRMYNDFAVSYLPLSSSKSRA
jgi:hypothetical protein